MQRSGGARTRARAIWFLSLCSAIRPQVPSLKALPSGGTLCGPGATVLAPLASPPYLPLRSCSLSFSCGMEIVGQAGGLDPTVCRGFSESPS